MNREELKKLAQEESEIITNRVDSYCEDLWNEFYMKHDLTEEEISWIENNI